MNKNMSSKSNQSATEFISHYENAPVLTVEELVETISRVQQGLDEALEELKRSHMRFVSSVAKQYVGQGLSFEELLKKGAIGLEHAANKYDVSKDIRFIAYAVWWIRQSILQAIKDKQKETE